MKKKKKNPPLPSLLPLNCSRGLTGYVRGPNDSHCKSVESPFRPNERRDDA